MTDLVPPATSWTVQTLAPALPSITVDATATAAGFGETWRFEADGHDDPVTAGVTILVEYGLIRVSGKDAGSFLQGQLTNDVSAVAAGTAQASGYCTPKGRMLASFWVWRDSVEDDSPSFLLACSRDLTSMLVKRLSMFVMRAKVRVESLDCTMALLGFIGDNLPLSGQGLSAPVVLPAANRQGMPASSQGSDRLPGRAIAAVEVDALADVAQALTRAGYRWLDSDRWRLLEVRSGIARINAATQERFVPQMLNFERTGGVSFTKGCYPGQEVVARTQYLGKSKRRMFLGKGTGPLPAAGQDVLSTDPQATEPVGAVVLAAMAGRGIWWALFECRISAADEGILIGASRVELHELPYRLEDEADIA